MMYGNRDKWQSTVTARFKKYLEYYVASSWQDCKNLVPEKKISGNLIATKYTA
jgi:hypothetical protein